MVSSFVELADRLSLDVVTEFIESKEEKELLHQMGCNKCLG
ncbi:MAG: hypothetical protein IJS52_03190 [Bacilli bacterium]|nr:hypothetical protein [Bacilli bacterium]